MPKAYVIGLGRSGIAAAKLFKKEGWDVILGDRADNESLQQIRQDLAKENITVKLGHTFSFDDTEIPNLIVVSPGVPWDIPILVEARNKGINTIGELELAWRYLKTCPWVGITGTNGKTTTTSLLAAIFQSAGLNAPACGNIGFAACELALKARGGEGETRGHGTDADSLLATAWREHRTETQGEKREDIKGQEEQKSTGESLFPASDFKLPYDWIIAEISSYQIESSFELAPKIGIWTTFTPDHLARHKTLDNYYNIKTSLLKRCQYQIFNGDDPYLRNVGLSQWQNAYWTSVGGKNKLLCEPTQGVYLEDNWVTAFGELVMPVNLFKMSGTHNLQNLLLAVAAARLAGIDKGAIADAIATFPGVPHRLEYICTVAGVDFINDSKATNYDAAEVGLNSVKAPAILIAGGEAKEGDDTAWLDAIYRRAAAVLLIGDAAPTFAQRLQASGYEAYEIVETMDNAVKRGLELARARDAKVVLLSPACASFDQYQSFEHRGEYFRQLCSQL